MTEVQQILDAIFAISSDLDLAGVLHRIVQVACDQTDAEYGALGVLGSPAAAGEILLVEFVTEGIGAAAVREIGRSPRGVGILGHVIHDARPLRLDDLGAHPDAAGFPPGHPPMTTFLGAPVRIRGEVYGNLYLTEKRGGRPFTSLDETLVVALSSAAGIAIENARLHARVNELASIHDRERIARELHDTVIQRLFATGLGLQGLARVVTDVELSDKIQGAVDDLDATIREIRGVIFELQSGDRDVHGLRVRVLALAAEMTPTLGFEPRVRFEGPVDAIVGAELAEHVLSALRELLSNVSRHAHATAVEIGVRAGVEVTVTVTDNGVGLHPELAPGQAIARLSDGARALGGSFTLEPSPMGGVVAIWSAPRQTPA